MPETILNEFTEIFKFFMNEAAMLLICDIIVHIYV